MKKLILTFCLLSITSIGFCDLITADADGYGNDSVISTAFEGMTLTSTGGYSGLDGIVYAWEDGLASTGSSVFANNLSFQRQWSAYITETQGFALRADFDQPADSVEIDIIGNDSSADIGGLYAYNSSGDLLNDEITPELEYGEVYTANVTSTSFDIAYIIAGGAASTQDTVHLDNLTANVIPEPATLSLLTLGCAAIAFKRKR